MRPTISRPVVVLALACALVIGAGAACALAEPISVRAVPADARGINAWQIPLSGLDASRRSGARTAVAVIDGRVPRAGERLLGRRLIRSEDAMLATGGGHGPMTRHALMVSGALAGDELGACPGCRVISIGVMRETFFGDGTDDHVIAHGLARARALGARVVNMSLGGGRGCSARLRAEVARTIDAGIVVVAAAGNDDRQRHLACPANLPDVISVGALSFRAGDAGIGPAFPAQRIRPRIWAFGEWVPAVRDSSGAFMWDTGSSIAAPQVSGAIAALIARPGWRVRDRAGVRRVIARLRERAQVLADGRPLLDAAALLADGATPETAVFADRHGRAVIDTRAGAPVQICARDGAELQVRAARSLTRPEGAITHMTPAGQRLAWPGGIGWTGVRSLTLGAGQLHAVSVHGEIGTDADVLVRPEGGCP